MLVYTSLFGLNKMDSQFHEIYMDHELEQEVVTTIDKCKDIFLNILFSYENW